MNVRVFHFLFQFIHGSWYPFVPARNNTFSDRDGGKNISKLAPSLARQEDGRVGFELDFDSRGR
jgi:hypothetical protein